MQRIITNKHCPPVSFSKLAGLPVPLSLQRLHVLSNAAQDEFNCQLHLHLRARDAWTTRLNPTFPAKNGYTRAPKFTSCISRRRTRFDDAGAAAMPMLLATLSCLCRSCPTSAIIFAT